jgi:hypothetical protein
LVVALAEEVWPQLQLVVLVELLLVNQLQHLLRLLELQELQVKVIVVVMELILIMAVAVVVEEQVQPDLMDHAHQLILRHLEV